MNNKGHWADGFDQKFTAMLLTTICFLAFAGLIWFRHYGEGIMKWILVGFYFIAMGLIAFSD